MSPTTGVPEKQWVLPHSSTQTHRQLQWSQDSSYFQVVLIKLGSELNHYSLCLGIRWHVAALAASGYPGASEGTCSWVTAQSSGTELCAATGAGALLESEIAWGRRSCLQVCHGELTPKSTLLKAATAEDPGQQSRSPRSLGEEDRRMGGCPLTWTPTLPWRSSKWSRWLFFRGRRWLRHTCDGEGWGIIPGTDGTTS